MKYRTLKTTPEGKQPREKIRDVVRGVHVIPLSEKEWQVRTTGIKRIKEVFSTKNAAVDFAKSVSRKKDSKIVIHNRRSQPAKIIEHAALTR